MALAGFGLGALLARLPWWAAAAVIMAAAVWVVTLFVGLNRETRQINRELAELQRRYEAGG